VGASDAKSSFKPRQVLGKDVAEACAAEQNEERCDGFVSALQIENGDRFLSRNCPPALSRSPGYMGDAIRAYLTAHPSAVRQLGRDVVFHAETEYLSRLTGKNCREK
jgi:hypothetical protein